MVSAAMVPNSAPASPATAIPAIHSCMCPKNCAKACNDGITAGNYLPPEVKFFALCVERRTKKLINAKTTL